MSVVPPASPPRTGWPTRPTLWDALSLLILALFAFAALVWRYDATPLQLWDESRNANNALEIALNGHWLTPTFGGVPDHWNTKPPLLIWLMAAGLKLGLPPLMAIRLPSWIAAFGTLGLVWTALRFGLKDRIAAFVGGGLMLSSLAYVGAHAARTGDFDALESLFVAGYVLSGWAAFEDGRRRVRWLAATGAFAMLAVMTKGVAGLLAAPGLVVFALVRSKALLAMVRDWRTWLIAAAALGVCLGYYLLRERFDPGYIRAVLANEVGGRFMTVSDEHRGGSDYYLQVLATRFEPGLILLSTAVLPLAGRDVRRRSLALVAILSAVALLAVLSAAKSKLDWYATPMIPLFATAAAVGTSDLLAWVDRARPGFTSAARIGTGMALAAAMAFTVFLQQTATTTSHGDLDGPQFGYARLFARIEAAHAARSVIAVDDGFANAAGFKAYNPILKFYALREAGRGLQVAILPAQVWLGVGADIVTCDPSALDRLRDDYRLTVRLRDRDCVLARITSLA